MLRYLVLHDTDDIKRYVFATNKLKEIRGASALLEHLNRQETGKLIKDDEGVKIYAGGGGVGADFPSEEKAKAFCKAVSTLYREKTLIGSSTGVVEAYEDGHFKGTLKRAHRNLRRTKDAPQGAAQLLTSAYLKFCDSCGSYPANHQEPLEDGETPFLCEACHIKRKVADDKKYRPRIYEQFFSQSHKAYDEDTLPKDFSDIGECSEPQGYLGVVYSDGNRMGEHLTKIKTLEELRPFSTAVDEVTLQVISEVLQKRFPAPSQNGRFPFFVPIAGGDDLLVITTAQDAIPIALDFLKKFQAQMKQRGYDVSASAGVAIAHDSHPIAQLQQLAGDLLKSAKRLSHRYYARCEGEIPTIDFQVVTTPSTNPVKDIRKEFTLGDARGNLQLVCRPYTTKDMWKLLDLIKSLKEFPRNKLHAIYHSLWNGLLNARLHYLIVYNRCKTDERKALKAIEDALRLNKSPWEEVRPGEYRTPYVDIMELYEFVQ